MTSKLQILLQADLLYPYIFLNKEHIRLTIDQNRTIFSSQLNVISMGVHAQK